MTVVGCIGDVMGSREFPDRPPGCLTWSKRIHILSLLGIGARLNYTSLISINTSINTNININIR